MTESESGALPLGDAAILEQMILEQTGKVLSSVFWKKLELKASALFSMARGRVFYAYWLRGLSKYFLCEKLAKAVPLCYNMEDIYPWHSWIARQTPTLQVEGSNPFG